MGAKGNDNSLISEFSMNFRRDVRQLTHDDQNSKEHTDYYLPQYTHFQTQKHLSSIQYS